MKRSLLLFRVSVCLWFLCYFIDTNGQTVIFSEDFSGFTNGSHSSQSSYDYSPVLDSKTQIPGWTGSKIYSAGGEIKLGTADITGWIETPLISFTGYEGTLKVKFDICRWTSDATTVRVLQDGTQIGSILTPGDNFETIEIALTSGVTSGKIKFEGLTKRFYLDNVSIISVNTPTGSETIPDSDLPSIFPNPARDRLTIRNITGSGTIEILDIYGKKHLLIDTQEQEEVKQIDLSGLSSGIFIIRINLGDKDFMIRFLKMD